MGLFPLVFASFLFLVNAGKFLVVGSDSSGNGLAATSNDGVVS